MHHTVLRGLLQPTSLNRQSVHVAAKKRQLEPSHPSLARGSTHSFFSSSPLVPVTGLSSFNASSDPFPNAIVYVLKTVNEYPSRRPDAIQWVITQLEGLRKQTTENEYSSKLENGYLAKLPICIVVDDIAYRAVRRYRDKKIVEAAIASWRARLPDPALVYPRPVYVSTARNRRMLNLCPWTASAAHSLCSWLGPTSSPKHVCLAICETCKRYRWWRHAPESDDYKESLSKIWKEKGYAGDTGETFPLFGLEPGGELVRTLVDLCAERPVPMPTATELVADNICGASHKAIRNVDSFPLWMFLLPGLSAFLFVVVVNLI